METKKDLLSKEQVEQLHQAIDIIQGYAPIKHWIKSQTVQGNLILLIGVLAAMMTPFGQMILYNLDPRGNWVHTVIPIIVIVFNILQRFRTKSAIGSGETAAQFANSSNVLASQVKSAVNDFEQPQ